MNMRYLLSGTAFILIAISAFFALSVSKGVDLPANSGKMKVSASFYPVYFLASEIGGEMADVVNVTPPGTEPHEYEPTTQQMVRIESSDVLVLNGAGLEPWGERILLNLPKSVSVVLASDGLATLEAEENAIDPHVWLSPVLAERMADKIADSFKAKDPSNAEYYEANAASLKARLSDLDEEYSNGLASCAKRDIVTSHAAFGYIASAYDLNQVAIAGLSPEAEPSSRELVEISKFAKDNGIKHIFFESLASPKLSEVIAKEIGAETMVLNPLEGLSSEEIAQGRDYFTEMRDNLFSLKIALQCEK